MSYSKPLSEEKKDASGVKKNQASKQTRKGLAYNTTGDPRSAANTKSTKSQTINAPNFSYGGSNQNGNWKIYMGYNNVCNKIVDIIQ